MLACAHCTLSPWPQHPVSRDTSSVPNMFLSAVSSPGRPVRRSTTWMRLFTGKCKKMLLQSSCTCQGTCELEEPLTPCREFGCAAPTRGRCCVSPKPLPTCQNRTSTGACPHSCQDLAVSARRNLSAPYCAARRPANAVCSFFSRCACAHWALAVACLGWLAALSAPHCTTYYI